MITTNKIKKFIEIALKKLEGEFVLLGGTLLPLYGDDYRVTVDIDFVSIGERSNNRLQSELMEIAEQIKIPVESINMLAEFFLKKIKNYETELVLMHENAKVKIFRPSVYLYLQLKLARLSFSDKDDCLHYIKIFKPEAKKQKSKINEYLNILKKKADENVLDRIGEVQKAISILL